MMLQSSMPADAVPAYTSRCFQAQPVAILLVDDDPDYRTLIRDVICHCGMNNPVYEVGNGQEALRFLRKEGPYAGVPSPGLIYLDIEMPCKNGQETLKEIRQDPQFADIAVVMMTSITDDAQKCMAMANGANSFTNKPMDPQNFIQIIRDTTNYWLCIHQFPRAYHTNAAFRHELKNHGE